MSGFVNRHCVVGGQRCEDPVISSGLSAAVHAGPGFVTHTRHLPLGFSVFLFLFGKY